MSKVLRLKNIVYFLLILLVLSPVTGELWRLSLGGFAFLPSDIILPALFLCWAVYKIRDDRALRLGRLGKMILIFLFVLVITFSLNLFRFEFSEMTSAFAYLGRLSMYFLLPLVVFDLLSRDKTRRLSKLLVSAILASLLLISLFGFLQLKFFPSFLELGMYLEGWDPHIGRLLSTWFDPNFTGGYLSFVLGVVFSLLLYFLHKHNRNWFLILSVIALIGLIALYLTYSRSGYLAFMAVIFVLALLKSRKLLIAGVLVVLLAFGFSSRVQERTLEALDSGKALLGLDSQKPLDPTAELRVWSWRFAFEIIEDHPWIGMGYNRYPYEINRRGHGLLSDHASGGSDSSLLTLWATSGIFGLLSYLLIFFVAAAIALRRSWTRKNFQSYLDAGFLSGMAGLLIHSVFVNSLLFPLIMIYLFTGLGFLDEK